MKVYNKILTPKITRYIAAFKTDDVVYLETRNKNSCKVLNHREHQNLIVCNSIYYFSHVTTYGC